jgi:hypothetical protein
MARGEDTSRDPRRKVSRLAHVVAMHANNAIRSTQKTGAYPELDGLSATPELAQSSLIDPYRDGQEKWPVDGDIGYVHRTNSRETGTLHVPSVASMLNDNFKNRHNKDYKADYLGEYEGK